MPPQTINHTLFALLDAAAAWLQQHQALSCPLVHQARIGERTTLSKHFMHSLSATVRLRPIRFAFLVRPDDKRRVMEVFRVNTCLWGGKFNVIVPYFRKVPRWWERHFRFESASQIIDGYLDRYEPDFLVETEKGLAAGLGFDSNRVVQLGEVLRREDDRDRNGYGLSIFDLYKDLYKKEFQFQKRHAQPILQPNSANPNFDAFNACVFGAFPKQKPFKYFSRAFHDAFDPKLTTITSAELTRLYSAGYRSAIDLTHANIDIDHHDHSDVTLFVLNAHQSRDLIDFWNLRNQVRDVLAVPVQWVADMSDYCRELIARVHRPIPGNPHGVKFHTSVLFSRSIASRDIEDLFKDYFMTGEAGAVMRQDLYPSIWRKQSRHMVRSSRPTLTAGEKRFDLQYSDSERDLRFDSLHPAFAERFANDNRWANVVTFADYGFTNRLAMALPTEYRKPTFSPYQVGGDGVVPTSEGLVTFERFKEGQHYFRLPDGSSAVAAWLKARGIESRLSDAGKITQQVVHSLGGFAGASAIANVGVVKLLNEISRRSLSKSMEQHEFVNRVDAAVKGDIWLDNASERLISRGAVEIGLELKCTKCSTWSWYAVDGLRHQLRCSLCLQDFAFPTVDLGSSNLRWAYRLVVTCSVSSDQ